MYTYVNVYIYFILLFIFMLENKQIKINKKTAEIYYKILPHQQQIRKFHKFFSVTSVKFEVTEQKNIIEFRKIKENVCTKLIWQFFELLVSQNVSIQAKTLGNFQGISQKFRALNRIIWHFSLNFYFYVRTCEGLWGYLIIFYLLFY